MFDVCALTPVCVVSEEEGFDDRNTDGNNVVGCSDELLGNDVG